MNDGRVFKSPPSIALGNPENPLTKDEIESKFFELALSLKTQQECRDIFDTVMNIEKHSSSKVLTDLL